MGKIAFLFAGQGSQYAGMGKDLYENIPEVKSLFDSAEGIRPGTLTQMFSGTEEELKKTENTQPCLFLADYAGAIALEKNGIKADAVAGFSLGEVVAMAASKTLSTDEAFKLVCKRGKLMQTASEKVDGVMIAVMRMDKEELIQLCKEYEVYPVNFNCPGQIVVSGKAENIERLKEVLTEKKVRFVQLAVGGAFHTPYMAEASKGLKEELESEKLYNINKPYISIYANKTAKPYPDGREKVVETLTEQISNSVKWEETLTNMAQDGVDTFIECGPGKTLSGFVKRTIPGAKIYNVSDLDSLKLTTEELKNNA
ncbi:[acyl-carrier-protein] S-malonyltransferase [Butyrivibrio sp. X503]|uniref:ACP S-malonyltransferase n=1 Tax=Butyrivibrio sp. X503 TaxID=2364878 RepID=UPI000EA8DA12|nr:ACP S-malonyltransferase [Butyrivibrio sp. X503]RKM53989.1 [acyl-carrier-protein] S-malonyltransferase [Butyrivibrio sp. X503]